MDLPLRMDTTDDEKLRILTMWECGKSAREIAASINKSTRTVQRWLLVQKNSGHMQGKERGKRPRKTTPEEDARLIQLAEENPDLTQKEIITICNVNIYKSTLRRRLQEARAASVDEQKATRIKKEHEGNLIWEFKEDIYEDLIGPAAQPIKFEVAAAAIVQQAPKDNFTVKKPERKIKEEITLQVEEAKDEELKSEDSTLTTDTKHTQILKENGPLWERNGKDTTDTEKSKILIMYECGMSVPQIAKAVQKSRRTIHRWLSKHSSGESMEKKARGKRPRKTTPEEDAHIIEFVKANPHLSRRQIMEQCNLKVHKVTLKSRLNEAGIFYKPKSSKKCDVRDVKQQQPVVVDAPICEEVGNGQEFNVAIKEEAPDEYNAPKIVFQTAPCSSTHTHNCKLCRVVNEL